MGMVRAVLVARGSQHPDRADHPFLEVVVHEAAKGEFARLGKLPCDHARVAGRYMGDIGLVLVMHAALESHHFGVLLQVLQRAEHHLVAFDPGIHGHEPDDLALIDGDFGGRELIRVAHLDDDRPRRFGWIGRAAEARLFCR
jgi:hypothetical protein